MTTAELAERAGTTKRTIRYYLAEGLLPPAGGTSTRLEFHREHELRLRLIQHLQAAGIKLGAVKNILGRYSLEEMEGMVAAFDRGEHPSVEERSDEVAAPGDILREAPLSLVQGAGASRPSPDLWRRIRLADEVELLVRAPLDPPRNRVVQEIISYGMERLTAPENATASRGRDSDRKASESGGPPLPTAPGGASAGQPHTPKADEEAP